jgi:hypothetical protein
MSGVASFVSAVQKGYGMRPVFPFEQPIAIGDIGTIGEDGRWGPVSTTQERFKVALGGIRRTIDGHGTWNLSSGKDVSFKAYIKGETSELFPNVADAKARAEIHFASSEGFVFAARGVTIRAATEMSDVIAAIRKAYRNRDRGPEKKRWYEELRFVFAVGDADRYTAMLAKQSGTTVAAFGRGKVGPPLSAAQLVAGVSFSVEVKEIESINESKARGRFYRAYRLKPGILARWDRVVEAVAKETVLAFNETLDEV